jgi:galactokinase
VPAEHDPGARPRRSSAFAPGRVNLIGEHTDYNEGLALPFAIREGVSVSAQAIGGSPARIVAHARDLAAGDEFPVADPPPSKGWRAFVRGVVAELARAGAEIPGARLEIAGELPRGAGLSSSAAMEVALCLALLDLCAQRGQAGLGRIAIARLCARVENEWVGAQTGLLDQLACLYGRRDVALLIDFRSLEIEPIRFVLGDWRLFVLDSGQRHSHASSGYNERRRECERACEMLGVRSLRETSLDAVAALPQPLRDRAAHVLGENERVRETAAALADGDMPALGALLDAAHASLRDRYEVSTPALEGTVRRMREAGAAGARVIGGGFGGSVLGLFASGAQPPPGAREVRPGPGAHLIAS